MNFAPSTHVGSSPRVRGAAHREDQSVARAGIIPARAGSSRCHGEPACSRWDHPRACGEQPAVGSL